MTEGFLTVTAQRIISEWEFTSNALKTCPMYDQHTSANLSEVLKATVVEWKLEWPGPPITVTTDHARNIVKAVCEAGLGAPNWLFRSHNQFSFSERNSCQSSWAARKSIHHSTTAAHKQEIHPKSKCQFHWVLFLLKCIHSNVSPYLKQFLVQYISPYPLRHKTNPFFTVPKILSGIIYLPFQSPSPLFFNL